VAQKAPRDSDSLRNAGRSGGSPDLCGPRIFDNLAKTARLSTRNVSKISSGFSACPSACPPLSVQSPDMAKFAALCFLAAVTAANAQDNKPPTSNADVIAVNLNGGLKAQLLSLAREDTGYVGRWLLTAAVKITNPTKDYAFLLFYDQASALDDGGVNFSGERSDAITGVEWCQAGPPERCFGIGNPAAAVPVEQYTQIDPGELNHGAFPASYPCRDGKPGERRVARRQIRLPHRERGGSGKGPRQEQRRKAASGAPGRHEFPALAGDGEIAPSAAKLLL
jgi:hypothetical protein